MEKEQLFKRNKDRHKLETCKEAYQHLRHAHQKGPDKFLVLIGQSQALEQPYRGNHMNECKFLSLLSEVSQLLVEVLR